MECEIQSQTDRACSQHEEFILHLYEVIWKDRFVDKIAEKHGVVTDEVEEVLFSEPLVRFADKRDG